MPDPRGPAGVLGVPSPARCRFPAAGDQFPDVPPPPLPARKQKKLSRRSDRMRYSRNPAQGDPVNASGFIVQHSTSTAEIVPLTARRMSERNLKILRQTQSHHPENTSPSLPGWCGEQHFRRHRDEGLPIVPATTHTSESTHDCSANSTAFAAAARSLVSCPLSAAITAAASRITRFGRTSWLFRNSRFVG